MTSTDTKEDKCGKDKFQCSNGKCVSSTMRCNYFNDCEDYGSDEIGCKTGERSPELLNAQSTCTLFRKYIILSV